jgi:hypothetical protein
MALKYADNVGTQLFDALPAANVYVVVESVSSFPTGISITDPAVATLANDDNSLSEQVKITNIDRPTKTFTLVRGQYGSTALDWPKGTKIEVRLSAGFMSEFEAQIKSYTDQVNTAQTTNVSNASKASFATAFILS